MATILQVDGLNLPPLSTPRLGYAERAFPDRELYLDDGVSRAESFHVKSDFKAVTALDRLGVVRDVREADKSGVDCGRGLSSVVCRTM
jgi:hypothetical protein